MPSQPLPPLHGARSHTASDFPASEDGPASTTPASTKTALAAERQQVLQPLAENFDALDKNRDGSLTLSDLQQTARSEPDRRIRSVAQRAAESRDPLIAASLRRGVTRDSLRRLIESVTVGLIANSMISQTQAQQAQSSLQQQQDQSESTQRKQDAQVRADDRLAARRLLGEQIRERCQPSTPERDRQAGIR